MWELHTVKGINGFPGRKTVKSFAQVSRAQELFTAWSGTGELMFETCQKWDESGVDAPSWNTAVLGGREGGGDPVAQVFDPDAALKSVKTGSDADWSGVIKLCRFAGLDKVALTPGCERCGPNN